MHRTAENVAAGIRELEIPNVGVTETLRPPVLAERALAGADVSGKSLTYVFQRTTGDDPFRRESEHGSASAALVRDRGDGERGLTRVFSPPAARTWEVDGWASVPNDVVDPAIDRLAGVRGEFFGSSRFQGRPAFRASSAFDGTSQPWVAQWPSHQGVQLEWVTPRPETISTLTLDPVPGVRRPTLVRVVGNLKGTPPLTVGADGVVRLPEPLRARNFRLEILRAAFAPGTPGVERQRRAVGIAEVRGTGVPRVQVRRTGPIDAGCSEFDVGVGGRSVGVRLDATLEDLDAGRPLRFSGCSRVSLPAGETRLYAEPDLLTAYLLRLRSPGTPAAAPAVGEVVSQGTATRGGREGVQLALDAPARLILAEGFNRGRRASCDGRDLGEPSVGAAFGTAWKVPADCRSVAITFAPEPAGERGLRDLADRRLDPVGGAGGRVAAAREGE